MKNILFILIMLVGLQTAFAQQKVAILSTEDDGEPPLKYQELSTLTAKLRDIANKTLPKGSYDIMTEQSIQSFLGSAKEMAKVCRAADGCLAKIGRDIEADYIGQARISRFGKFYSIRAEIYDSRKGTLVASFVEETAKDIYALLAAVDLKAPDMFEEINALTQVLPVEEPKAVKTQEPDIGILNIKPSFSDGIGKGKKWKVVANDKPISSGENKLPPGAYSLKLSHRCYEDIQIDAVDVLKNTKSDVAFADKLALKQSSLVLKAAYKGKPVSEPVFINGKQAGETVYSGTIPQCSEVEIGKGREAVNVDLNSKAVEYTHNMSALKNILITAGLGLVGAALIYKGIDEKDKNKANYDAYSAMTEGENSDYDNAWKKVEDNKNTPAIYMVGGGAFILSAVGVYVWF